MLKDYSQNLGIDSKLVLDYGSRNAVNIEEEILKKYDSIKQNIQSKSPQKATELVINADNASHDIGCCIAGIAARRAAIEIYNDFMNLSDREFMKSMASFCQKRITEGYAMIDIAQAAYNTHAGNYEEAEVFVGQAKNKAHDIGLKARNDLKEIIDAGNFSKIKLAEDVARDFGDYWNEYDELIKSIRTLKSLSAQYIKPANGIETEIEKQKREKRLSDHASAREKSIETAKRLFVYTSALNYVLASAKSERLKKTEYINS